MVTFRSATVLRNILTLLLVAFLGAACTGTQVLNSFASGEGETATNLIYDRKNNLRLDVYAPQGARYAPVVVFFHPGRWSEGNKDEYLFVGQALVSLGFVAVIPNLRQYPQVRFPAFVEDAALAVKWTRENIESYGGTAQRLFLMGHSSGAHVAAMLALNEKYLQAVGGSRAWLKGMIGLSGPYDFMPLTDPMLRDLFGPPTQFAASQPIAFVDGRNPPLLLMHGEDDEVVDIKNSRSLARAVEASGGAVETVFYPKMSHRLMLASLGPGMRRTNDVLSHIDAFVREWADVPYGQRPNAPAIVTQPLD